MTVAVDQPTLVHNYSWLSTHLLHILTANSPAFHTYEISVLLNRTLKKLQGVQGNGITLVYIDHIEVALELNLSVALLEIVRF